MKKYGNRYLVQRVISMDSMGKTLEVVDEKTSQKRKFRIFNRDIPFAASDRFLDDFLFYSRVRHCNILRNYRFDVVDNSKADSDNLQYYYTSEYVDETKRLDYRILSLEERLCVLECAIRAICYLNFMGIVYGRLTFENVFIIRKEDGSIDVKLNDLASIVAMREGGVLESAGSKFVVSGRELNQLTPKADIFSLAKMSYYLFTGCDYEKDSIDFMSLQGVDERFADLIALSTHVDPDKRPESVLDFWRALVPVLGISIDFTDKEYYENIHFSGAFVAHFKNRDTLIENTYDFFAGKFDRSAVFVRSREGMGKSRFLLEIRHRLKIAGLSTHFVAGEKGEKGEYPTFARLLRSVLSIHPLHSANIERLGADLLHLVPEYSEVWGVKPSGESNPGLLENRIIARSLSHLGELAAYSNTVFMIDDVDALNENELDLLAAIIKIERDKSPFLILSVNDMPAQLQEWDITDEYYQIELEPFNYNDTVKYLKQILNIGDVAKLIARAMNGLCHGNPRIIEKSVGHLYQTGKIVMSEDRKWEILALDFSIGEEEKQDLGLGDIDEVISKLSDDAHRILKLLSVYSQKVDVFFAIMFSGMTGKVFLKAMEELLNSKIILKTTSDWGNYYEFSDYRLINLIYQGIDKEEKLALHARSALTYETQLDDLEEAEFDSYVYHLILSDQKDKALDALVKKAESLKKQKLFAQALEYYEYALSINDIDEDTQKYLHILNNMAVINYRIGEVGPAEHYFNMLSLLARDREFYKLEVEAYVKLTYIYLMQGRTDVAQQKYDFLDLRSKSVDDDKIYIDRMFLEIRLLEAMYDFNPIPDLADELYKEAKRKGFPLYCGLALIEKARKHIVDSETDLAINCLLEAESLIIESTYERHLVEVYRLLGKIYVRYYSDASTATKYLDRALELAEKVNMFWETSMVLIDVGYLKQHLGFFDEAKSLYVEAERNASRASQSRALMLASVRMAEICIDTEDFESAKQQLDKYEDLFEENKHSKNKEYYYYFLLIKTKLFLEFRVLPFVETMVSKIKDEGLAHLSPLAKFKFFLLSSEYSYIISAATGADFDANSLRNIKLVAVTKDELILLKRFLLDLAITSYTDKRMSVFELSSQMLGELKLGDESTDVAIKCELVNSLKRGSIETVRPYAEDIAYGSLPYSWRIFCILADLLYENSDKVSALAHYIEAAALFFGKVYRISYGYRAGKMKIEHTGNRVVSRILDLGEELYGCRTEYSKSGELDKGFIFSNRLKNNILKDRKFQTQVKKNNDKKHGLSIQNWQSLIAQMDDETKNNVERLIVFLTQYTMAQYGAIMLVDENGEVVETMSTDAYYKTPSVLDYVSRMRTNRSDYEYVEKSNILHNLDWHSDKSILVFAIYLKEDDSRVFTRRTEDQNSLSRRLLAYVYLEASREINNINIRRYKNIKKYEGLCSLIINEYNVTKNATIDKLTGTYVRSYVQSRMQKLAERSDPNKWCYSVLMLDIDHFKDVNDNYGHRRGDEVLSGLGAVLKDSVRKTDIVGRYGGEEFIVILVNAPKSYALPIAEKVRAAVEKARLLGDDRELTISIGSSSYPNDGKQLDTLIENADKALYYSKNNGRNRVSAYDVNMSKSSMRYDRLAGIMTPNASENSRRMKAVLDVIAVIASDDSLEEKLRICLGIALDIVEGIEACVIMPDFKAIYSRRINDEKLYTKTSLSKTASKSIVSSKEDGAYVNWEDEDKASTGYKTPNWKTYAISSLKKDGSNYGRLFVWSTIRNKEYSYNDYSFLAGISPLVATVLVDHGK